MELWLEWVFGCFGVRGLVGLMSVLGNGSLTWQREEEGEERETGGRR